MNIFLFDDSTAKQLYPFSATRAMADVRVGMFTNAERWQHIFGQSNQALTQTYITPQTNIPFGDNLFINASTLPTDAMIAAVQTLQNKQALFFDQQLLAFKTDASVQWNETKFEIDFSSFAKVEIADAVEILTQPFHIFQKNEQVLRADFKRFTYQRLSAAISETNKMIGDADEVFLEEGAEVEHCYLNTTTGPIYIGKNAKLMEGSMLRGPIAIGENSLVKMGACIYGATSIGPNCVVGGEIKNSVLFGHSNKAHHGYLGDSVIGEWCNLGAGTSNSNLKNNASEIALWNPYQAQKNTVGNKCGLLMGDYSKAAINSSFNTGTMVGVAANVFGNGLTPKTIASFAWGAEGKEMYALEKAFTDIDNWKKMKQQTITESEKQMLTHLFAVHQLKS
jgi:UDP-N-acetylglucosamine diphosphorylase / glucose-1-phosphate thymidylyltransferase / UDP-N-acetylgalactosamine diphosphorylase / glucosamine-1-phosphate N-acetyltransferase / galactosamine-1-phosphate N-acetyltransferase